MKTILFKPRSEGHNLTSAESFLLYVLWMEYDYEEFDSTKMISACREWGLDYDDAFNRMTILQSKGLLSTETRYTKENPTEMDFEVYIQLIKQKKGQRLAAA